jgi:hypothetical protein
MWADLPPLLIGAGATLATTTFVQLWVVPRVESGKRREDRWERNVLGLSEYLAFEYADAQSAATSALYGQAFLANPPETAIPERLAEIRAKYDRELRESFSELSRAKSRARLMLDRVTYLDRDRSRKIRLDWALILSEHELDRFRYAHQTDAPLTDDQVMEASRKAHEALKPLTEYLDACMRRGSAARSMPIKRRAARGRQWAKARWSKWRGIEAKPANGPD